MFVFKYFPGLESICLKFKYFQEAWEPCTGHWNVFLFMTAYSTDMGKGHSFDSVMQILDCSLLRAIRSSWTVSIPAQHYSLLLAKYTPACGTIHPNGRAFQKQRTMTSARRPKEETIVDPDMQRSCL